MRSILLLVLGVPIPIIILIGLFSHFWSSQIRAARIGIWHSRAARFAYAG